MATLDHFYLNRMPLAVSDETPSIFGETNTIDDGLLWHYTDAGGLIGIIEHNALWASSTTTLNDSTELRYGLKVLDQAKALLYHESNHADLLDSSRVLLNTLVKEYSDRLLTTGVFVLCASTAYDSLGNWRAYTQLDGYAVGLSRQMLGLLTKEQILIHPANRYLGWQKVHYEPEAQTVACGWLLGPGLGNARRSAE